MEKAKKKKGILVEERREINVEIIQKQEERF